MFIDWVPAREKYFVRDLLPLYIEGDCGKETETFIKGHISSCEECGELYELMKEPIELGSAENEEVVLLETEEKRFQQRYYGLLLIKAACWFGAVFIAMLIIKLLI
ncbi:zf-HC2 domain-containing protein [Bacillus atrophaeus]|uniref:zf-HC2 domain-containing protein n=1 Tax=Bacillus atrophaeus TaxID=1452 RepID=UPI00227DBA3A|nr:zf-HC2 domain-containing protein [Bacillus atrophaeus]MCY8838004.1 zf-HC2 domain-containing protein [Bacillus atrophaeus]MEC5219618.1 zf-HC2 domain-containing protein [Bacillus atrophaeus]MED4579614.1 zf-HC2 domain-containing protein [Bacillus atrophaeus]MED4720415.1 zf-HC2 domain-containing protein [Bacillus atrophaeus]